MKLVDELQEERRLIMLGVCSTVPISLAAIGLVWALWAMALPLHYGWPFGVLVYLLGLIAYTDAREKLLPLSIVAAVAVLGLALNLHAGLVWWQIALGGVLAWGGALLVGILGTLWAGRPALGAGDVWLAGALGLVLGTYGLAPWLVGVAVVGGVQALWLIISKNKKGALPFAPALILGAWLALMHGNLYYMLLLGQ